MFQRHQEVVKTQATVQRKRMFSGLLCLMVKLGVVTAGVMMKGNQIQPIGGVAGGRRTRNKAIHAKWKDGQMTPPSILWIVVVLHRSAGVTPIIRKATMTNVVRIISGLHVGVPMRRSLKIGVVGGGIQAKMVMFPVIKVSLSLLHMGRMETILKRRLNGMIIFLVHGNLVILWAVDEEICLIIPLKLHRNHLVLMDMVEGSQTMILLIFQVVGSLHLVQMR
ncbi:unnamed protein product [Urochloa decumbens]|uniref:Uncharacterized protein n=1 Tax=Urochloa decumbens TaxID=240449 RepID=A0ABC9GBZ0_9POAL